ncbi:MAG: hypothetical protein HRT89_10475, partial [Lentisphaeria bacterium]|nr:hypothetical protein [Lentisphaeria bacterium]
MPGEIFDIYFDRNDKVWLAGSSGLSQFVRNKRSQNEEHYNKGHYNKGNGRKGPFIHYNHLNKKRSEYDENEAQLRVITQDSRGTLLIGSRLGKKVYQFDPINEHFGTFIPFELSWITAIHEDAKGRLWFGTYRKGLYRLNKSREKLTHIESSNNNPGTLNGNRVNDIYEDRQGVIWIATMNGLNYYTKDSELFSYFRNNPHNKNSLGNGKVTSFLEDSTGEFWIGTDNGLNRYDPVTNDFKLYLPIEGNKQSLPHSYVTSIYEDHRKKLWIGTTAGLARFNKTSELFKRYQHSKTDPNTLGGRKVLALQSDKNNQLFVGTDKGLNRYDPETDSFNRDPFGQSKAQKNHQGRKYRLLNSRISVLYLDTKNRLWIGGRDTGLGFYDNVQDQFNYFKHKKNDLKSISDNWIFSLVEDKHGTLWVGTHNGLNRFDDKNNQFERFYAKDKLLSSGVIGLLNDSQGNIWASSNLGLTKMNPRTQQFTYYKREHLMIGTIVSASYRNKRNELFFGGINGYVRYSPDKINMNIGKPNVVITDFLISNRSISILKKKVVHNSDTLIRIEPNKTNQEYQYYLTKNIGYLNQIILTHVENLFAFEFSALHFSNPEEIQYQYQLQGWNDNWISTNYKNRMATFTNLSAGN